METPFLSSVTWNGSLLGFSGVSPVGEKAILSVDMRSLNEDQDLNIRDILFLNKFEEDDTEPSKWFPVRNMDYR